MSDFSTEMTEARGQCSNILNAESKSCRSGVLCPVEIPSRSERAMKTFADIENGLRFSLAHSIGKLREVFLDEGY